MCGRFTLTRRDLSSLASSLEAELPPGPHGPAYRARYNIAPTDQHWIARQKQERRELLPAKWGLVNSWSKDAKGAFKQINARSETALTSRAFRSAFLERRCVVPADGFYEWIGSKQARRPIWFHPPADDLLLFAGLYESWLDPQTTTWLRSFTILTTSANDVVAPVHNRMPVILSPGRIEEWLFVPAQNKQSQAEKLLPLLGPAASGVLVAMEVSSRANSVANDDPECLTPAAAAAPEVTSPRLL
ncbi:MAG: SOS response-associated peptidase [Chloroflexota bacterium]|nr:SOS response-associated peptidase [Chloroflexota bacterium]